MTRLSRDSDAEVKCTACRAAGALASAELEDRLPAGSALVPLMGVMTALLGPDQFSEVQRQQLQVSIAAGSTPLLHVYSLLTRLQAACCWLLQRVRFFLNLLATGSKRQQAF